MSKQVAWAIQWPAGCGQPVRYWCGGGTETTPNHDGATWLARRQDAEAVIERGGFGAFGAKPCRFTAPSSQSPQEKTDGES